MALRVDIDNWRWAGVPFFLRTGKRLPERRTQVVVQFKPVPHSIFGDVANDDLVANRLVIDLQPDEDIELLLMNKAPGISRGGMRLQSLPLSLSLLRTYEGPGSRRRIAYERLLLDVIRKLRSAMQDVDAEIAHLKVIGLEEGAFGVANLVGSGIEPELSLPSHSRVREMELIVNARVATDPAELERLVRQVVPAACAAAGATAAFHTMQSFRPGRPQPTHRYAAARTASRFETFELEPGEGRRLSDPRSGA